MKLTLEEREFILSVHRTHASHRANILHRLKQQKQLNPFLKQEQTSFLSLIDSARPLLFPDSAVLLLGCSPLFLFPLLRRHFRQNTAVDPDPEVVATAQAYKYPCYRQFFEELSFYPNTFDFLIAWNVLQLSLYPMAILGSIYNTLKPGGILAHATPHHFPDTTPGHICPYDSSQWSTLYRQYGFQVVSSQIRIFSEKEAHIVVMKT